MRLRSVADCPSTRVVSTTVGPIRQFMIPIVAGSLTEAVLAILTAIARLQIGNGTSDSATRGVGSSCGKNAAVMCDESGLRCLRRVRKTERGPTNRPVPAFIGERDSMLLSAYARYSTKSSDKEADRSHGEHDKKVD